MSWYRDDESVSICHGYMRVSGDRSGNYIYHQSCVPILVHNSKAAHVACFKGPLGLWAHKVGHLFGQVWMQLLHSGAHHNGRNAPPAPDEVALVGLPSNSTVVRLLYERDLTLIQPECREHCALLQ